VFVGATVTLLAVTCVALPAQGEDGQPLVNPTDPQLSEMSGIAANPQSNSFWVHQDAGREPYIYLINDSGGTQVTVRPTATGLKIEDAEDIAIGPGDDSRPSLYLSDGGDAFAVRKASGQSFRTEFQVIRIVLPTKEVQAAGGTIDASAQVLPFEYPDGANRNSEAMLVDPADGAMWMINKSPTASESDIWQLPNQGFGETEPVVATGVGAVGIREVSGGAADPFRRFVVLRDATKAYLYPVAEGQQFGDALAGSPTTIELPPQPQGEGVTVTNQGDALVINSEKAGQPFLSVSLPTAFIAQIPAAPVAPVAEAPRSKVPLLLAAVTGAAGITVLIVGARQGRRRRRV